MSSTTPTPGAPTRARVVLAEPDSAGRAARAEILRQWGFVVSAQAGDAGDAKDLAIYYTPDLLLLATALPGPDVVEVTGRVLATRTTVGVVILTEPDEELGVARGALLAGARGIVPVDAPAPALGAALRAILSGFGAVPPECLEKLVPAAGNGFRPIHGPLSNREWQIVDLLIAGRTVAEVTDALVLTEATMRSHLKHMYQKLDVHSRDELLAAARRLFTAGAAEVSPPRT
jgi:DNA-binding NarL/FixJ family response regulator